MQTQKRKQSKIAVSLAMAALIAVTSAANLSTVYVAAAETTSTPSPSAVASSVPSVTKTPATPKPTANPVQTKTPVVIRTSSPVATSSPVVKKRTDAYGTIGLEKYRKTLTKGFLGKRYGAVIDGISCDCSGYVKAALGRMKSTSATAKMPFKDYKIKALCAADWVKGTKVDYLSGTPSQKKVVWDSKSSKGKLGKTNRNHTNVKTLKAGDVMVYGQKRQVTHIALFYGKFQSAKQVKNYLEKKGYIKKGTLKKVNSNKYTYKGRTVIRSYSKSKYWRIHSTYSGILIDNDIPGVSRYTADFGRWKWTFESGLKTE
ncbi:MAG: hypothetical protein J1E62_02065 [Lachnospiraceae bacterium]|nr:hypothetical protein [Lachnospiraceae bacterium]